MNIIDIEPLIAQRDELVDQGNAILNRSAPTNDDLSAADQIVTQVESLNAQIERAKIVNGGIRAALAGGEPIPAHRQQQPQETPAVSGLPGLLPTTDQIERMRVAGLARENFREDIVTRSTQFLSTIGGETKRLPGALSSVPRLASYAHPETVPMAGASGPKFSLLTAEAPTAEGGTKPEAGSITQYNLNPQALARWSDISVQGLAGANLSSITAWHQTGIVQDENKLIVGALTTEAATPVAYATDVAGNIRNTMAGIEDAVGSRVNVIICNPADYSVLAQYSPVTPEAVGGVVQTFTGAAIFPTSQQAAGTVLVAALGLVGVFGYVGPASVSSTLTPKTNTVTVLTEEFADFAIRQSGGVKAVTISA